MLQYLCRYCSDVDFKGMEVSTHYETTPSYSLRL